MTTTHHSAANPFALLIDPQAIFRSIENSERLGRLHSRVCRPLDRPLLPVAADEVDSFDNVIELTDGDTFGEPNALDANPAS